MMQNFKRKLLGFIALTRWKEIYDYTLANTLYAAVFAGASFDSKLLLIYFINFIIQIYAFMVNDVEDAEDDAKDPQKLKRNPISNKTLSKREGSILSAIIGLLALTLSLGLGLKSNNYDLLVIAISTLIVMFLYSWKRVRLKSMRIWDIASHAYMLSGGTYLLTYFAYNRQLDTNGWIGLISGLIFSIYGQFDNQIRDYVNDKACNIKNTTNLIGLNAAKVVARSCVIIALGLILYYLITLPDFAMVLPWLLITAFLIIALPALKYFFVRDLSRFKFDLRKSAIAFAYLLLLARLLNLF